MASGKPVLTADLPECRKYASVERYSGAEEFIAKAQLLAKKRDDPKYLALLEKDALANTWGSRIEAVLGELYG